MDRHSEYSKDENIISNFTPSGGNGFSSEASASTNAPATIEVIGVKFKESGKVYYFSPGDCKVSEGEFVIVETARGVEFGTAVTGSRFVPASEIIPPLRPVIRIASDEDVAKHEENAVKEKEALSVCARKIKEHNLDMKLIDAEYTFDGGKLIFYFSADGRVDFRNLVKDLASVFKTRIELRQIGIRDEAKLLGGLGVCGRPFCCTTFLSDFVQVSIKMAKEQNMSLNSSKISGTCGRLMCCLKYEQETYEQEIRDTPPVDSRVKTPDGTGVVKETSPLTGMLKVQLDGSAETLKEYHRSKVAVIGKSKDKAEQKQEKSAEIQKMKPDSSHRKSSGEFNGKQRRAYGRSKE